MPLRHELGLPAPQCRAAARGSHWLKFASASVLPAAARGGCGRYLRRRWPRLAATMNFSESFKLSGLLCKFSPDGKYLVSRGARGITCAWAHDLCRGPERVEGGREGGPSGTRGAARGTRARRSGAPGSELLVRTGKI